MTLALAGAGDHARSEVARPFARVERCDETEALAAWRDLEPAGAAYQRRDFVLAWAQAFQARLTVVVARDADGEAVALLPLWVRPIGPVKVASFAGGPWANYHMGLFRPGIDWTAADAAALLRAAAAAAAIDLFAFFNQPQRWEGRANPFAALASRRSPSAAFASPLPKAHGDWLDAHFSRATQKKLRKKARKLETLGPVAHVRAETPAQALRFLDALLAHKSGQAAARGEPDPFARAGVHDLLRGLVAAGAMEMHALTAGERVAAAFGALRGGARLSGLVVSYDSAPEIAAATPGEWLLIEVVRDAIARGLQTFDLGVGESRYKSEICEVEEILVDGAYGVTPIGRVAAAAFLAGRAAHGWIKQRPKLLRLAVRLRRAF